MRSDAQGHQGLTKVKGFDNIDNQIIEVKNMTLNNIVLANTRNKFTESMDLVFNLALSKI